jgi:hypothetical protein
MVFAWSMLSFLFAFLSPTAAEESPKSCKTTFVVTSCGKIPVEGAKIKLFTGYRKSYSGKTGKDGRVTFNQCMLNFKIPGEPKMYMSSGDSAYVYKVFPSKQIIRITDDDRVAEKSRYLRYTYFGSEDVYQVSDSILLYRIEETTSIVKMNMKYTTNRAGKLGLTRASSKMKLGKKAIEGFVTGKCYWDEGGLICPINICS